MAEARPRGEPRASCSDTERHPRYMGRQDGGERAEAEKHKEERIGSGKGEATKAERGNAARGIAAAKT